MSHVRVRGPPPVAQNTNKSTKSMEPCQKWRTQGAEQRAKGETT
jgi:hypothetical protein